MSRSQLTIHRNRFLRNGQPHLFRGIVYQLPFPGLNEPSPPNPRSVPPQLRYAERDVINDARFDDLVGDVMLFEELGINALWIYQVTPGVSHRRCMALLAEKNIDVFIGMSNPSEAIIRNAPHASYTPELLQRYYNVVDAFQGFANVAGFVVANEVVNDANSTAAATIIKAVVRDVKAYSALRSRTSGGRTVPVGVSDGEWALVNTPSAEYYTRGDATETVDFYACVNFGAWPGSISGQTKWDLLLEKLRRVLVPVLVSEYGANVNRPRDFMEVRHLYSEAGRQVFSAGGMVYEFYEAANQYGVVKRSREHGTIEKLEDFEWLKVRFDEVDKSETSSRNDPKEADAAHEAGSPYSASSEEWHASSELPPPPLTAEQHMRTLGDSH